MTHRRSALAPCLATLLLACASQASAIEVQNLEGFEEHFGRYAPGGDCKRQPQVVVDRSGFTFEGGPPLPKSTRPDYAASFMGNDYEGISLTFFPYTVEPRPFVLIFNAGEAPGVMTMEPHDLGYPGGPAMPEKYRPYLAGSPYRKCR